MCSNIFDIDRFLFVEISMNLSQGETMLSQKYNSGKISTIWSVAKQTKQTYKKERKLCMQPKVMSCAT